MNKKFLWHLAVAVAYEDTGVYPQSIIRDGVKTDRTPQQDGWNDCVMEICKNAGTVHEHLKELDEEMIDLIINEILFVNVDEGKLSYWINTSDIFVLGADSERFNPETDMQELRRAFKDMPENGDLLWVARKQKIKPHPIKKKNFSTTEWVLFEEAEKFGFIS